MNVIKADALLRVVKEKLAAVSGDMRKYAEEYSASKNLTVTCVPGCAHCCYQKLLVTASDGMTIYAHLRQTGRWNQAMIDKLVAADKKMTEMDHFMYFILKTPCPFLVEEKLGWGQCSERRA